MAALTTPPQHDWHRHARLVILPGLDGTGLLWQPWVEVLPGGLRRQVFAYPPDRLLGYEALTRWVVERIEGEAEEPVVLVGESFGGPLALRVAAALGGRVKAVVLVATFGWAPLWPWACRAMSLVVRWAPPRAGVLRFALGDGWTPAWLVALAQEAVGRVDRRVLAARVRAVAAVRSDAVLRELATPLMYVRAERDRLVGPGSVARLRRVRPDMHVACFDTPHLVAQHEPAATWSAVDGWVRSLAVDWAG
ncbi:MAG: alpha/beta hydrolase [Phycisphaeraceae bacterium]